MQLFIYLETQSIPVITLAVRAFNPMKLSEVALTESQREAATVTTRNAMWSVMNMCAAVLDYVCARMQVHAWRELACPECDVRQSTRSALFDPDINKVPLTTMQLGYDRRMKCNGLCLRIRKKTLFTKDMMLGKGEELVTSRHFRKFFNRSTRCRLSSSHSVTQLLGLVACASPHLSLDDVRQR